MNELLARAYEFAELAHRGQKRKYTGEPYIVHPMAVSNIVSGATLDPEVMAAAYLHDVVEDTDYTLTDINTEFGPNVARYVAWVTDVSTPWHGNRAERKTLDLVHLSIAPCEAQTIKLADLIDNTKSIVEHDPGFARVYLKEKANLLRVLTKPCSWIKTKAQRSLDEAWIELAIK